MTWMCFAMNVLCCYHWFNKPLSFYQALSFNQSTASTRKQCWSWSKTTYFVAPILDGHPWGAYNMKNRYVIAKCCFKGLAVLETWHSVSLKSHRVRKVSITNWISNFVWNKLWKSITKQMFVSRGSEGFI